MLADVERRLARPGESRIALVARLLASALRELDERKLEERYLRYQPQPESEEELRVNHKLSRSLLER